ncbi:MAG: hypothetical protein SGJ02_02160 [bacterium]|nr:hypothetical protein [bacterium]
MNNEIVNIIAAAINTKKVLSIIYDGYGRIVEPHAIGTSTEGCILLRAFQSEGGSNHGGIPEWRLFDVSKIGRLDTTGCRFSAPRQG